MSLNIAVLGASGHVGQRVVRYLLSQPEEAVASVHLVNRRALDDSLFGNHARLIEHVVDMSSAEVLAEACTPLLAGTDVIVVTMGIGSGKGSLDDFRKVDVELPSAFATAAVTAGVGRAVLLTSVGTNIEKTWSVLSATTAKGQYFHLKGVVEKNFAEAGFPGGVACVRPAGLLGTSHVSGFFNWLLPAIDWIAPARFRSIHIDKLGEAMALIALDPNATNPKSATILQGKAIFDLLTGKRTRPGFGAQG